MVKKAVLLALDSKDSDIDKVVKLLTTFSLSQLVSEVCSFPFGLTCTNILFRLISLQELRAVLDRLRTLNWIPPADVSSLLSLLLEALTQGMYLSHFLFDYRFRSSFRFVKS